MQGEFLIILKEAKRGSPFSETDAIADIFSMADENGEFCSTTRKLMDRWGWSNTKTVSFISKLEEKDILKTQKRHKKDTLYCINTRFFVGSQDTKKTQKRYKKDINCIENTEICKRIIDYLNKGLGTNYRYEKYDTQNLITERLKEGYTEQDFYTVIDKKVKEWKGTTRERYLSPDGLFGNRFEKYLNQGIIEEKSRNKFNDFPQREYDFEKLEKELLKG